MKKKSRTLTELNVAIEKRFGAEIKNAINAELALTATLAFKNRPQCLSLILVGPPSAGKSIAVESFYDADETYFHRVDDFTPAAFVSHSANKTLEDLKEIDLLPKLPNKTMLTKELSPLFNGDEKEMLKNFSVLTAVLDGDGFYSHKGTHGGRGYKGKYRFNWIGATTEFPDRTYHLMGRLGNRLLFWEMGTRVSTEEELLKFCKTFRGDNGIQHVRKLIKHFLTHFFEKHPVDSAKIESTTIPEDIQRSMVRYATLLAHSRVTTRTEKNFSSGFFQGDEFISAKAEGPHRIIIALQLIARGSALIHDRTQITNEDLQFIQHLVFSSIPEMRRKLIRLIASEKGELRRSLIESKLGWSKYIANKHMKEFSSTGVVVYVPGESKTSTPPKIRVADSYAWLAETDRNLFKGGSKGTFVVGVSTPPIKKLGVRGLGKRNIQQSTRSHPRKFLGGGPLITNNKRRKKLIALYNDCARAIDGVEWKQ